MCLRHKRFAVVASIAGAGLEVGIVIIMGFASLFAVCRHFSCKYKMTVHTLRKFYYMHITKGTNL
jgi:hypothetical protein